MSFYRHGEIYHPDGGLRRGSRAAAPSHRGDEFPAGYSFGRVVSGFLCKRQFSALFRCQPAAGGLALT